MSEIAVLGLGANLGDPAAALAAAIQALREIDGLDVVAISPAYRTAPVGGPDQPDFLNLVVLAHTDVPAEQLLAETAAIEQSAGRTRDVHWGPRTLDIDLIVVGDLRMDTERLTLPHPRAHERAFVLKPWLDIDPQASLPGHGSVKDLLSAVSDQRVEQVA